MLNLSLGRRHLVNAYEVVAGIGVIAGNTMWSMPERLECEVLQKARYINTLNFTFYLYLWTGPNTLIILFLASHFNFLFIPCGRLSWLRVSFLLHVKYTLLYRRIVRNDLLYCYVLVAVTCTATYCWYVADCAFCYAFVKRLFLWFVRQSESSASAWTSPFPLTLSSFSVSPLFPSFPSSPLPSLSTISTLSSPLLRQSCPLSPEVGYGERCTQFRYMLSW